MLSQKQPLFPQFTAPRNPQSQFAWPHVYPAPAEAPISSQLFMLFPLTGRRFVLRRFGIIRNALEYLERGDHPLGGICVVWHIGIVLESMIDQSVFIDSEHEIATRFVKKSHSISNDILSFRL
ncbi:MAG: hypothetical protein ACFNZS_09580 [Ottowia sp.]